MEGPSSLRGIVRIAVGALVVVALASSSSGITVAEHTCKQVAVPGDCVRWVDRFAWSSGDQDVSSVLVSPDGSTVYAIGDAVNAWGVRAYDTSTGVVLWTSRIELASAHSGDSADHAVLTPDGAALIVAGRSGHQPSLARLDAIDGAVQWSVPVPAFVEAMELADDGSLLVLAARQFSNANWDVVVHGVDPSTGTGLWTAVYAGPAGGHEQDPEVAISPDGSRVFVVMESWGMGTREDIVVRTLDAVDGSALWTRRINTPLNDREQRPYVAVSPDGTLVAVTARTKDSSIDQYVQTITTVLTAADGTRSWTATEEGAAADLPAEPRGIVFSPDASRVYVTMSIRAFGNPCCIGMRDALTNAYDADTGDLLWAHQYDSAPGTELPLTQGITTRDDIPSGLVVSADGTRLHVALDHRGAWGLLTLDADGRLVGQAELDAGDYYNYPGEPVLSPDGATVLVGGPDDPGAIYHDASVVAAFETADPVLVDVGGGLA